MSEDTSLATPYPGLRPFEADETHLFFGREEQTDELLRRLRLSRFLAVVGSSGSGKSSLVRAGLLPSLYGGFMLTVGSVWRVATLRPGADPIGNLAAALNEPDVLGFGEGDERGASASLFTAATLRRGPLGLVQAVKYRGLARDENLLVVVDQFEELFRFAKASAGDHEDDSAAFVKLLLEAAAQDAVPIYIVLTMRSDFLGDCARFRGLPEAINDGQYLIPRLTRDQLRAAMVGPAAVGGAALAPRLVQRLLGEVGDDPDQLPVLQHALMRTWDTWEAGGCDRRALDLTDYLKTGGMDEALSRHADEAWDELPDDRSHEIARRLFQRLTEKGDDHREIRRPTRLAEICEVTESEENDVKRVVEVFRRPGRSFLMPPAGVSLTADATLDISHESLMRVWTRLRDWVEAEAESARRYDRLAQSAALHAKGDVGFMKDPELSITLEWRAEREPNAAWAARYDPEFERARVFLEKSRDARDSEMMEIDARRASDLRRARRRATILGAAFGTTLVFFGLSVWALGRAAAERQRSLSAASVAVAWEYLDKDVRVSVGLLRQVADPGSVRGWRGATNKVLRKLGRASGQGQLLSGHEDRVTRARFSPDGSRVLTASDDGTARIWDADTGLPVGEPLRHDAAVGSASFSPDGRWVLTASQDGTARIWDAAKGVLKAELRASEAILVAAISPDGTRVLTASVDGTARLWDAASGAELAVMEGHEGPVWSAAFSPDARRVVTASADGTARLWDAATAQELAVMAGHQDSVSSAAFSPDAARVLTASADGTARLWDAASGRELSVMKGHEDTVWSAAFSPDGKRLLTASADRTARLWDAASGEELAVMRGHEDTVWSAAFSPDGKRVLTASRDGTARLWTAQGLVDSVFEISGGLVSADFSPDGTRLVAASEDGTARILSVLADAGFLEGHEDRVTRARFSPDGSRVLTASDDGTARIWDADTGLPVGEPLRHDAAVGSASFSPDGRWVLTASQDRTARIWDAAKGVLKAELRASEAILVAAISPDGTRVLTASVDGTARLWDAASGRQLAVMEGHEGPVWSAAFSPDARRVVTASADGTARLWDAATAKQLAVMAGHQDSVSSAAFSPDAARVLTASADGTARLWDAASGRELAVMRGHTGRVWSAAFSPDAMRVVTASADRTARLWDAASGAELAVMEGHTDRVWSAAFSPDGGWVLTASRDGTARLWTAQGLVDSVFEVSGGLVSADFSPDGTRLVAASADGTARILTLFADVEGLVQKLWGARQECLKAEILVSLLELSRREAESAFRSCKGKL